VRWGLVKLFKLDVRPLVFVAPRGLITILLFFKIPDIIQIPLVNKSLVIQVIVLSAIVMMVGMMICKMPPPKAGDDLTDSDLDDADRPEELENVTQEATRIEFDLEDDRFDK